MELVEVNFFKCVGCARLDEKIGICAYSSEECDSDNLFKVKSSVDNVNKPSHYNQGKIETIDYIQDKLTKEEFKGFCKGNIIKYISRERLKNGLEDVRKAEYYIKKLITLMEDKKDA